MFERLSEPVSFGDVIMIFPSSMGIQAAEMWIVQSIHHDNDSEPFPLTRSIMVSPGRYSRMSKSGRWSMFGPDVHWDPDPLESPESEMIKIKPLQDVLMPLAPMHVQYENVVITVNPHGRDVFRDYFQGVCPLCRNQIWIPSEVEHEFPQHLESQLFTIDHACPVCMGLDFAETDFWYLEILDEIKSRIWDHEDNASIELSNDIKEFLDTVRERYTAHNRRRREMGLPWYWDVGDRVRVFQRIFVNEMRGMNETYYATDSEVESEEEQDEEEVEE